MGHNKDRTVALQNGPSPSPNEGFQPNPLVRTMTPEHRHNT